MTTQYYKSATSGLLCRINGEILDVWDDSHSKWLLAVDGLSANCVINSDEFKRIKRDTDLQVDMFDGLKDV